MNNVHPSWVEIRIKVYWYDNVILGIDFKLKFQVIEGYATVIVKLIGSIFWSANCSWYSNVFIHVYVHLKTTKIMSGHNKAIDICDRMSDASNSITDKLNICAQSGDKNQFGKKPNWNNFIFYAIDNFLIVDRPC